MRGLGLSMQDGGGGSKPQAGKGRGMKRITLGPGLFDPTIQGGGPEKVADQVSFLARCTRVSPATELTREPQGKKASVQVDAGANYELVKRDVFSRLFKDLDADGNGKIDRDELGLLAEALGGGVWGAGRATMCLRSLDTDRDGLVSDDEVWAKYSTGGMTKPGMWGMEAPPVLHRAGRDEAQSIFQMMDGDSSGVVDVVEFEDALAGLGIELAREGEFECQSELRAVLRLEQVLDDAASHSGC